jgi:hypothetical protein
MDLLKKKLPPLYEHYLFTLKKISTQTEHLSSEKLHAGLFYVLKIFLKKFKFFSLLQINIILVFSYHFNALIVKIIFLKKIYILF